MDIINFETQPQWRRPITGKRFMQGPFSGYLYSQWPNFKCICHRAECTPEGQKLNYALLKCSAFAVLVGKELNELDFTKCRMLTRDDGTPIHAMEYDCGDFTLTMENFCDTGRVDAHLFTKLTLKNTSGHELTDRIGLLCRTGPENHLTGNETDGYTHLDPNIHNMGLVPNTWTWDGRVLTDGKAVIDFERNDFTASWHGDVPGFVWAKRHLLSLGFTAAENETLTLTMRMSPEGLTEPDFRYEEEREKAEAFWQAQRKRIRRLPKYDDRPMLYNIILQLLQFFTTYVDEGFVAPRQGGLNRHFWAAEADEFLIALEELGDFSDYTTTSYDFFFQNMIREGEDRGQIVLRTGWASNTGTAVKACAYHVLRSDKKELDRYRADLLEAFGWMERMRQKSYEVECEGKGIFPPLKGTDWPGAFQSWCITDCQTILGYKTLAEAFEKHGDPMAPTIRAAYEDYMSCMKKILAAEVAKNDRVGEILLPNRLGIAQTDPPMGPYFGDGPSILLWADVIDANSETAQLVENFFRNRCCMQKGLTGLMNDGRLRPQKDWDAWAGHTWYLSTCDSRWYYTWMKQGKREKALTTIEATVKYGMSPEYQMIERYADNDPCYLPYQPNASANGRLLMMLCDFFGEETV